ncbi:MAG: hypothetical protein H6597_04120 [Flavobacteriales bacterium]|nr:hypothetical protein [Flavobacteriales bacterium]
MLKIKREYYIALMVIAGVVLLIFGVNYLKGWDLLERRNVYHAVYSDISGVTETTPLLLNGYKVGSVVGSSLMEDGSSRILVSFQINEDDLKVPKDSRIVITGDLLNKWTALELGISEKLAHAGDTLEGRTPMSLTESVTSQIDPLKRKAEGMLVSVDSVLTVFQSILNPEARMDIDKSFMNIRTTLEHLSQAADRLDKLIASEGEAVHVTLDNLNAITGNLKDHNGQIAHILENLDTASASLADGKLDRALASLDSTLADARGIMGRIESGQGTLGKLVTQDSLYDNLEAATRELEILLEDVRLNPDRYVHISVFGRKDKLPKLSENDVLRISDAVRNADKR